MRVLLLLLISLLHGCATFSTPDAPLVEGQLSTQQWHEIKTQLEALASWKIMGKIGVRTEEDSVTAAINQWTQVDDFFDIQLSSTFFGLGSARINGNSRAITLSESGEDPVYSEQPEALIAQTLGVPLPLPHLPYWIKGLPVPHIPYEIEFSERGVPSRISQLGWTLELSKHQSIDNLVLPGKIKLKSTSASIILAIKQWTLM